MTIVGNTARDDVLVLGGREFKRVKNGLDEAQVTSFIDELIKERDELARSQDHMASLNRLAEVAIVEADKLATQIKTEAREQARAESAAIIDKAKEQARQTAEKELTEAVELANEKANAIKAKAEQEATLLRENEKNKIRNEIRNLVNQQFGNLLEELERLKQQVSAVQTDFENKAPESAEDNAAVTVRIAEERDAKVEEIAKESEKTFDEHVEPGRAADHAEESFEISNLLQIEEQPESGKPQWEVEVLPPFEIAKIMEVVAYLDQLPEVANTEMIVPQIDAPLILVFLRAPIDVVDVLQKVPAVAYVEEVTSTMAVTNAEPRKVRIGLSANTRVQGR